MKLALCAGHHGLVISRLMGNIFSSNNTWVILLIAVDIYTMDVPMAVLCYDENTASFRFLIEALLKLKYPLRSLTTDLGENMFIHTFSITVQFTRIRKQWAVSSSFLLIVYCLLFPTVCDIVRRASMAMVPPPSGNTIRGFISISIISGKSVVS